MPLSFLGSLVILGGKPLMGRCWTGGGGWAGGEEWGGGRLFCSWALQGPENRRLDSAAGAGGSAAAEEKLKETERGPEGPGCASRSPLAPADLRHLSPLIG